MKPKKRRFAINHDPEYQGVFDEKCEGASETIPDQTLTLRQIVNMHTRGNTPEVTEYRGEFFEDIEIPKFTDITEMHEYALSLRERARQVNDMINEKENETAEHLKQDKMVSTITDAEKTPSEGSEAPKTA